MLVSATGGAGVPGASAADEDLLVFAPTSLGATTAGTWSLYLDGSDIALDSASSEDLHGASVDADGGLVLTTRGASTTGGVTGTGADAFTCSAPTTGPTSACTSVALTFDGSANGYGGEVLDALHVG